MKRYFFGSVALFLGVMLSACTTVAPGANGLSVAPVAEPVLGIGQLDDLLKYSDYIRKLSTPDAAKEFERASQAFSQEKSLYARLQLALLLSLPGASFHDDGAALNLLREGGKDPRSGSPELHRFANLLIAMVSTQKQLSDSVNDLTMKLKDEQKRADDLQGKLNAIKTMEKNLMQRDKR